MMSTYSPLLVASVAVMCLFSAPVVFADPECPPLPPFDIATSNAPVGRVIPFLIPVIFQVVTPTGGDITFALRAPTLVNNGWFDAASVYHEKAVAVFSRVPRRPPAERTTENINTAVLYASYHTMNSEIPGMAHYWKLMLSCSGLDPSKVDDISDLTSPVDIGNIAGKAVAVGRSNDGMNQLGNEGGHIFNKMPYADYTGYEPVNTAYDLKDPSRWQPFINRVNMGVYKVQQFVTPQQALVEPYSYAWSQIDDIAKIDPPDMSDWEMNPKKYLQQADEVLAASAALTDRQKIMAEFFDNKIIAFGFPALNEALTKNLTTWDFIVMDFLTHIAANDATIWIWKTKREHDAVRPFSAIHKLYEDKNVTAWAGPGMGTKSIPGKEWASYLNPADHPEYPSASACTCVAHAQAIRRHHGSDELNWRVSGPTLLDFGMQGTSLVEPGVTPSADLTDEEVTFATWSEWATDCGQSRVWAGGHFQAAVDASQACEVFGDLAIDYMDTLLQGTAPLREPFKGSDPSSLLGKKGKKYMRALKKNDKKLV